MGYDIGPMQSGNTPQKARKITTFFSYTQARAIFFIKNLHNSFFCITFAAQNVLKRKKTRTGDKLTRTMEVPEGLVNGDDE